MGSASLETLISTERLEARVMELARRISADYPAGPDTPDLRLIGVLKGAFVFLADLIRHIERDVSVDFLGVSSYGPSTESSGEVQIQKDLDHEIGGLDVVLVEDLIDTGVTLNYLCDVLRQRKPRSLRVAALLTKPSRRVVEVPVSYVGFEIPDKFVVGYGLDYDQRYRNLPDVCVLRE